MDENENTDHLDAWPYKGEDDENPKGSPYEDYSWGSTNYRAYDEPGFHDKLNNGDIIDFSLTLTGKVKDKCRNKAVVATTSSSSNSVLAPRQPLSLGFLRAAPHLWRIPRFPPHLHALVADGLFSRDGVFHTLPSVPLKPLEELFRAKVLKLLVELKLLPLERVQVLLSWKRSGFNVHHGGLFPPEHTAELEQLAQYILRNPFSIEQMTMESPLLQAGG